MKIFKVKSNLTILQKICLAGLFIAMVTILQKVIAINYVPGLPFVRLSFGAPALIIFSSVLLGPWFGALIGAASDILGYFIFDMSGSAMFPQITAIYALLGFSAYFVFQFVRSIYSKKLIIVIEGVCFALFYAFVAYYLFAVAEIDLWVKIVALALLLVLFTGLIVFISLYNKKVKFELGFNVFQISLCCFLLESIVLLAFGSLMKALAFGFDILPLIVTCQMIVTFFNVVLDTISLSLLLKVGKKYIRYESDVKWGSLWLKTVNHV